ncbi:RNA-directed DNA polymerase, eukaryota, reverse transcriptase zinc-binding domain protein [Tanacetum coccineum]
MWKNTCPDEKDVYDDMTGISMSMTDNELNGCSTDLDMQKDVKKFISEEKLSICVVLETHIKESKVKKISDFVFGTNFGKDRRVMWRDLKQYRRVIDDKLWVLMGDWNVSLHLEDHSEGGPCKTSDMIEFQERLEQIEVEDLNSL